jgi:hypothetical protein
MTGRYEYATKEFLQRNQRFIPGLVTYAVTIVSFVVSVRQSLPDKIAKIPYTDAQWFEAAYHGASISILLFLLGYGITSAVARAADKQNIEGRLKSIEILVSGEGRIVGLGSPNDTILRITTNVMQATRVCNVYTPSSPLFADVAGDKYSPRQEKLIEEALVEFLRKDEAKWVDVVYNVSDITSRMANVLSDPSVISRNYFCYQLSMQWPIMNFIVLRFGYGRDSEVYFGFGRHPSDPGGEVFFSTDKKLVNLFLEWHRTLMRPEIAALQRNEDILRRSGMPVSTRRKLLRWFQGWRKAPSRPGLASRKEDENVDGEHAASESALSPRLLRRRQIRHSSSSDQP